MTREKADVLRRLHAGPSILLFPNAWDVASARIVEQVGFPAVATSSAGVANVLGYADGERISRAEMLDALTEGLATARGTLSLMDDSRLMATWTLRVNGKPVMTVPRIGMLRTIMLNHWYHHRGQLVVYFRLLGVPVPSVYGPTADENPFAVSEAGSAPVGAGA